MSVHPSSWYDTTQAQRPQGTPGVYDGEHTGMQFPSILDRDGLLWYQTILMTWAPMRGWDASRFTPDEDAPEWIESCTHDPACTVEAACTALKFEQGSGDW